MIKIEQELEMESRRLLPESWRWVQLGEICDFNPRRPLLSRAPNSPTTFVPMSAVEEAGRGISCPECRPFSEVRSGYTYFSEGDVLFAKITPCMQNGKHAIAQDLIDSIGFGSTEFHVIRPKAEVTSSWIHWFILQPQILWRAEAYFTGSVGQQRVPQSYLEALEIPLPPLTEQYRITEILTKQIAVVEQARAATELQIEAARELPGAYLRAVFESPEAQQWPRKRLGEVCELLPSRSIATNGNTEVLTITTACLTESGFAPSGVKAARMWERDANECAVSPGEILIARSNTSELVGRVAMFSGVPKGVVASDLTIRLWPGPLAHSPFLAAYLSFLFLTGYWRERAGGASGSMKKITRSQVIELYLPVPLLTEQQRIAAILNEQMVELKRLRTTLEEQLAAINALPAVLLRRAFNGEL